jgi:hypothetical protein
MILFIYFDWTSTKKELEKWNQQVIEACKKNGLKYLGLFSPMGQKYNYVWMIETDSADNFINGAKKLNRPKAMTHFQTEFLIPKIFD